VCDILRDRQLHILGLTKYGYPKHPLYSKADLRPVLWKPAAQAEGGRRA
jgi:hypothetical protein